METMTWEEIKRKYPDQWIGLTDVVYNNNDGVNIKTAVVKYANKSREELFMMQMEYQDNFEAVFTTPDHVLQLGLWG